MLSVGIASAQLKTTSWDPVALTRRLDAQRDEAQERLIANIGRRRQRLADAQSI